MRVNGYKIVDLERYIEAYGKAKSDPLVLEQGVSIGLSQAHEGDNGHMLMAVVVLQQRQIEQNEKIIALLQDIKDKSSRPRLKYLQQALE